MQDGFYIVEDSEEITVLKLSGGEWHDYVSGDYASYEIKPTRIIERIALPTTKEIEE